MDRTCKNCKYFDNCDDIQGFCHRYPPVSGNGDGNIGHDTFPFVDSDDWCGEFEAKESEGE